jgi:ABC-2 type transport system ATP-binding protein
MIETYDLSKSFDTIQAVDGITLTVQPGEVLALLGPNGAGKTTTVRMLTSILSPSRGWARIAGYDVVKKPAQVRASVGVLTEMHGLYGRMPADEYLDFFGQIYNMDRTLRKTASRTCSKSTDSVRTKNERPGNTPKECARNWRSPGR